tara:strand:+ start:46 stop:378 length:333 start_codon:yes stop_codon:yes gene_type:complete
MPTWRIVQLERNNKNPHKDGVIVCHWECLDSEKTGTDPNEVIHYGRMYGSLSFEPNSAKDDYVKFKDLTEEIAISWVHGHESIDKSEIEASVAAQIADSKSPKVTTGVPW